MVTNFVHINWKNKRSINKVCSNMDVIIHTAGMNAKDSELDPVQALAFNGLNTARFVSAAASMRVKKFIYFSTAHVYRSPLEGVVNEDDCLRNLHPYATSHVAGENAVLKMNEDKKIDGFVFRISNAFGFPINKEANCWSLVVQDFCKQAIEKKEITINSNIDTQRNFVPIDFICKIINEVINIKNQSYIKNAINIGSDKSISIKTMADLISERYNFLTGQDISIIYKEKKTNHIQESFLNYSVKNLEKLNFNIKPNIISEVDNLLIFCINNFNRRS